MATGEITLDGTNIGGTRFSLSPSVNTGQENLLLADRGVFPQFNQSITGNTESALPFYKPQRIFNFNYWVTNEQRYAIDKLFLLANAGRRLKTPSGQYQFVLEDEREKLVDVLPPQRAYVAGSLETIGGSAIPVSRYYPIFNVVFNSEPSYPETAEKSGICMYRATFTLVEGDLKTP